MSFFPGKDPAAGDRYACDALDVVVVPRSVDLGEGFSVRRALPHTLRRTVGPFVFFDHFGPAEFKSGHGLDVRPHPHIGLSTLTYLYDGEVIHRDNLGVKAAIHPGAVNWMTAGRGIVHSERTAPERSPRWRAAAWVAVLGRHAERKRGDRSELCPFGRQRPPDRHRRGQERADRRRLRCSACARRSPPRRRLCSPMFRSKQAPRCRSMPTARSAGFISCRAKSMFRATSSAPANCLCSARPTRSR